MVLKEYDEAAHIKNEKEISFQDGKESILLIAIQDYLDIGLSKEDIIEKLVVRYQVPKDKAEEYFAKCNEPPAHT